MSDALSKFEKAAEKVKGGVPLLYDPSKPVGAASTLTHVSDGIQIGAKVAPVVAQKEESWRKRHFKKNDDGLNIHEQHVLEEAKALKAKKAKREGLSVHEQHVLDDAVAKFEMVDKSVSTKLRVSAQQTQDQGQMMQQAMEQATMSLAPKVAMEVERIRQERMMQMANDKNALQSGAQSPGQGPAGPPQYQGGPQIGLNVGPSAPAGPVQGPQTYV